MSSSVARAWFKDPQWWPLWAVTGITCASMGVWWWRKTSGDPELTSPDSRAITGGLPEHKEGGLTRGYGRPVAEATGMMEGDRPFQGIFPTKKITQALEGTPLLPSSKPEHPMNEDAPAQVRK